MASIRPATIRSLLPSRSQRFRQDWTAAELMNNRSSVRLNQLYSNIHLTASEQQGAIERHTAYIRSVRFHAVITHITSLCVIIIISSEWVFTEKIHPSNGVQPFMT